MLKHTLTKLKRDREKERESQSQSQRLNGRDSAEIVSDIRWANLYSVEDVLAAEAGLVLLEDSLEVGRPVPHLNKNIVCLCYAIY